MIGNRIASVVRFLREGIWEEDLRRVAGWRWLWLGTLRVGSHVVRRFATSLAGIQASGLTLITLLALVPMLALAFTIANAMGYGENLDAQIGDFAATLPENLRDATISIQELVRGISFGTLGMVGTLLVVWAGLMLFSNVEHAFNHIWRTSRGRSWVRRISDFIALVVLVPAFTAGALVLSSLLRGAELLTSLREQAEWAAWLYEAGLGIVPHVMLWIAFTMLYKAMPSARVYWRAALIGGICAGSAFVFLFGIYLRFQVGVAQANAIYGTLAALPMLLIYLQLAWTVIIAGAEVAYAVQNLASLRGGKAEPDPTPKALRRLGWLVVSRTCDAFRAGRRGIRLEDLAMEFDVPETWIARVSGDLIHSGLLVSIEDDQVVMPGLPPEQIEWRRVAAVMDGADGTAHHRIELPSEAEGTFDEADAAAGAALAGRSF